MSFAEEIRRQAEAAPRAALSAVAAALWRAFGAGNISEAEAEGLSELIEARRAAAGAARGGQRPNPTGTPAGAVTDTPGDRQNAPRKAVGSRPRTDASMDRRRRWAASGRLPPQLAARFTLGEQAALALVAAETARRGDCRLAVPHLAAVAGVSETTVRNALREARRLGLVTVEERRLTGFRNDTNVVRIVSPEWQAWARLARRETRPAGKGGGCRIAKGTHTQALTPPESRPAEPPKSCRGAAGDPRRGDRTRIRVSRTDGRAA